MKKLGILFWLIQFSYFKFGLPWLGAGGEGDDRGWDGWMASLTQWTWVWVNSGSWWWTGRPGVLRFMGSQRVGHNWVTEVNRTDGSDGEESDHNAGDLDSIPGLGRSPGEGNGNPLQYSCLENSMDRGDYWATVLWVTNGQTWLSNQRTFTDK